MHPRLYMQTFQYAIFNSDSREVVFETRHVSGGHYYFNLAIDQFLALDEVINLIKVNSHHHHYPLGQDMWLEYSGKESVLYKNIREGSGRINFIFENFEEYKSYTHKRLYSLVYSTLSRRPTRRRRHYARSSIKTHKRPLSSSIWSLHRSPTSERHSGWSRETPPRSSFHAELSREDETHSLLPKWDDTNSRRRSDSSSPSSPLYPDIPSPATVRLDSPSPTSSLESE